MATPTGIQCPATSIQSFPVGLSVTLTPELIDSVADPLKFQFHWTTRTSQPNFKSAESGEILEDLGSTVMLNGRTYTLYSVQLTNPTHMKWITPSTQQVKNEEDIILTFSYSDLLTDEPQFIIFVIPIIRSQVTVGDASYLAEFGRSTTEPKEVSLQSLIPARKAEPYLYYRTCCQGFSINTPPQNVLVVVSIQGLYVSMQQMFRIKNIFERSAVRTDYGPYKAPLTLNFQASSFAVGTPELFRERIKLTREIVSPTDANSAPGPLLPDLETETKSYQCVTLDPETQVDSNGKIRIDPNKGVPLNSVQAERDAQKAEIKESATKLSAEVFNTYVSTVLGIFFAAVIIGIVIFFLLGALIGPSAVGDGATFYQRLLSKMSQVPAYSVIGILAGFTGFMVGMILKHR
jgi:hypothetical protein